jgi:hypothetical protein
MNQQRSCTLTFIETNALSIDISVIFTWSLTFNAAISLIAVECGYFVRMLNMCEVSHYRIWCLYFFSVETKCLKEKSAAVLHKYYESKNHQKKQIQTGG